MLEIEYKTKSDVPDGTLFRTYAYTGDDVYMKVSPIGAISKSTVMKEMCERGYLVVVQLGTGKLKAIKNENLVEIRAKLTVY